VALASGAGPASSSQSASEVANGNGAVPMRLSSRAPPAEKEKNMQFMDVKNNTEVYNFLLKKESMFKIA